jgi:hypothetical protein
MAKKKTTRKKRRVVKKSSVRSMSPRGRSETIPHVPAEDVGDVVGGFVADGASEVSAVREGASAFYTVMAKWGG